MSIASALWLPPAGEGDVERAAAAFVSRWARKWFASSQDVAIKSHAGRSGEDVTWSGVAGASVGASPAALVKLGLALVDAEADPGHLRDREVLAKLAEAAVTDLSGALAEHILHDASGPASNNTLFRLIFGGDHWFLLLSLNEQTQNALRKSAAGQSRKPLLAKLSDALAPELVGVGCHVGSATLSASEVAGLVPGDLITFDSRIGEDLALTVDGGIASRGKAKVVHDGTGVVVRITHGLDIN